MGPLWYYTSEGRQKEPVSAAELERLAQSGSLKPTDMVWREGMPRWVRASSVAEIFPDPLEVLANRLSQPSGQEPTRLSVEPIPFEMAASVSPGRAESHEPKRAKTRREEKGEYDARPRREKPAKQAGVGVGVIVALVLGGGFLVVVLIAGVAIAIYFSTRGPGFTITENRVVQAGPTNGAPVVYTVALHVNQSDVRAFTLRQGVTYELLVKSEHDGDVDLHILDGNRLLAEDIDPSQHARLNFTPSATKGYRIKVDSLDGFNRSQVTLSEMGELNGGKKDAEAEPVLPADVRSGHGALRMDNLLPGQEQDFKLHLHAGAEATINVIQHLPRVGGDLRVSLHRDADNTQVAVAERGAATSLQLKHTPAATGIYRVRVHNAGKLMAKCTVTH